MRFRSLMMCNLLLLGLAAGAASARSRVLPAPRLMRPRCFSATRPTAGTVPRCSTSTTRATTSATTSPRCCSIRTPGSGSSQRSIRLRLPERPPALPNHGRHGGYVTTSSSTRFWFGMALCDTESSPNPGTKICVPPATPTSSTASIPRRPTTSAITRVRPLVEVQFYPPGWVPWPAADHQRRLELRRVAVVRGHGNLQLAAEDDTAGTLNNADCLRLGRARVLQLRVRHAERHPQGPPQPAVFRQRRHLHADRDHDAVQAQPRRHDLTLDLRDSPNGVGQTKCTI